jgi:RNA-binding protein
MPSGKLRQSLRGHGHRLSAIVQVGKAGITDGLVKQLEQALADHELVKLKVASDSPSDRFAVADQLAALPGVHVVQLVGGMVLVYKRHPSEARYEGDNGQVKVEVVTKGGAPMGQGKGQGQSKGNGKGEGKTDAKASGSSRRSKDIRRGPGKAKKAGKTGKTSGVRTGKKATRTTGKRAGRGSRTGGRAR